MKEPIVEWKGQVIYMKPPRKKRPILYFVFLVGIVLLPIAFLTLPIWIEWIIK